MEKFYNFKNETGTGADLYVYGALVDAKDEFWGESNDVDFTDFREPIEALEPGAVLNIYINSGGGSVFAASSMVSILTRAKAKGVKINAYVDGICASAATYIAMAADAVYIYRNSIMMVHKPATYACGNADDLQKEIEVLDRIQADVMLPLYMEKSKVSADEIEKMVNAETWLGADDIVKTFDVELINEDKRVAACVTPEMVNTYKNIPDALKTRENENLEPAEGATQGQAAPQAAPAVDYSYFEGILENIKIMEV